jgi:bacterioferritin
VTHVTVIDVTRLGDVVRETIQERKAELVPMKGNPRVIAELNKALREELTAINQYFLHAEMCENWGYHKLSEFIKKQSIGEMKHAEVLIERILFLDGSPSMQPLELNVGGTVREMLESDLALEVGAVTLRMRKSIMAWPLRCAEFCGYQRSRPTC